MLDFLIQKAYAQANPIESSNDGGLPLESTAFDTVLKKILDNIVNPLILLLMAVAVIYFLYGVFTFIQNADNPEKRKEGYESMVWGVIGIFIMVSAIGLKNLIGATLGL